MNQTTLIFYNPKHYGSLTSVSSLKAALSIADPCLLRQFVHLNKHVPGINLISILCRKLRADVVLNKIKILFIQSYLL